MSLEDYGWKVMKDQVPPWMTDLPAAPESLLQMIRCNCSSDCASARCTCRKHGLHVANAKVRRVQILQSSLTKMTAEMSKRVTWKWKHESHKIIGVPCETLLDSTARVLYFWKHILLTCMFEKESGLVAAYRWVITKCHSFSLVPTSLRKKNKICLWVRNFN